MATRLLARLPACSRLGVGGRRTAIIPANLPYGSTPQPNIPANSELVFDIELVSVG